MNDGIIKGNGASRYLRSVPAFLSLYPTYESFAQALIDGTLPVDFNGINEAGWTQLGTALNKASLLTDETAALYGLGSDAVPDEVLAAIKPQVDAAATAAASAVVKLLSATLSSNTTNWNVPVGTLDFDQYTAFLVYPDLNASSDDTIYLRLNNISDTVYGDNGKANAYFAILAGPRSYTHQVLIRKAQTHFTSLYQRFGYEGYEAIDGGGVALSKISSINSLTFACTNTSNPLQAGSKVTMYGWKK